MQVDEFVEKFMYFTKIYKKSDTKTTTGKTTTKTDALNYTIVPSHFKNRYARIKTSAYWCNRTEVFARTFEQYVCWCIKSAAKSGASTTYLCKSWTTYTTENVYLTEKDFKLVLPLFDKLVREFGKYCNGKNKVIAMPYPVAKTAVKNRKR